MPHPNHLAVLQALAQLPQPGGPSPLTPPFVPPLEQPEFMQFPTPEPPPPAPTRSAAEFLPEMLARVRGTMGPGTPPYVPPTQAQTPVNIGSVLGHILRNLPQAVAVGTSRDPGAALQQQFQQQTLLSERRRQEELARQEKIEDRRYSEDQFIRRTALGEAQQQVERTQKQQQDAADRRFELEVAERAKRLGLKDEKEMALFRDSLLAKRQREDDERAAMAAEAKAKAEQEKQAREFARDYRKMGAKDGIARELAEYDAGIRPTLSKAAANWQSARARIDERRAAGVSGGGAGGGTAQPLQAVLANGQRVPASLVDRQIGAVLIDGQPVNVVRYEGRGASGQAQGGQTAESPARAEARAKLKANGYSDAEATNELNRLGIK